MRIDEYQGEQQHLVPGSTLEEEMAHWHIEEAPWKVEQILHMLARHHLTPQQICEIGSGSGDMLKQLQSQMDPQCTFQGYELSPHAIDYSRQHENERLHFKLADIRAEPSAHFDLLLLM